MNQKVGKLSEINSQFLTLMQNVRTRFTQVKQMVVLLHIKYSIWRLQRHIGMH